MGLFDIIALIITVTAALSYGNRRYVGLPTAIGVMVGGLTVSLALLALGSVYTVLPARAERIIQALRFHTLLMNGMLSFLLFAGSLNTDVSRLQERRWTILILATVGTVISTAFIGGTMYSILGVLGLGIPFAAALVFGALISPTDPVAVLAIMREADAPADLESVVIGESLFNDGVGVVLYVITLGILTSEAHVTASHVAREFLQEAGGGLVWGLMLGHLATTMLRRVDDYTVEILITLAVVTGGYAIAQHAGISGPLAMVVAGLFIGSRGRRLGMSARTREHLDTYWLVTDSILNAVLFVLIGLEMLVLEVAPGFVVAAAIALVISIAARCVAVALPISVLRRFTSFGPHSIRVMTWSGLRGGIAVALALGLPSVPDRDLLVFMTYAIVVFSILVQGLTVGPLLRRVFPGPAPAGGLGSHASPVPSSRRRLNPQSGQELRR
ncbi:MAG: sodium:proton antiporter [Candidatus Binatia bacterium]